jgi:hypothetical protein
MRLATCGAWYRFAAMPEDLTAAVQSRVGRGKRSQHVTEAVTRQLELDLLAELSELLASEHGPVPDEALTEARAAWPDDTSRLVDEPERPKTQVRTSARR